MVGLLQTMFAEVRQVHSTPGSTILLGLNDHSCTPGIRSAFRNSFKYTLLHICLNVSPDLVSEVKGNHCWSLATKWFSVWLCMDFHWFACCHWPRLAFTLVEGRFFVIIFYPIFQCNDITGRGWHREGLWWVSKTSSWATAG